MSPIKTVVIIITLHAVLAVVFGQAHQDGKNNQGSGPNQIQYRFRRQAIEDVGEEQSATEQQVVPSPENEVNQDAPADVSQQLAENVQDKDNSASENSAIPENQECQNEPVTINQEEQNDQKEVNHNGQEELSEDNQNGENQANQHSENVQEGSNRNAQEEVQENQVQESSQNDQEQSNGSNQNAQEEVQENQEKESSQNDQEQSNGSNQNAQEEVQEHQDQESSQNDQEQSNGSNQNEDNPDITTKNPNRPTWSTCNFGVDPILSCADCNTRIICKPVGGLTKKCNNPYRPHCNRGICSPVPSHECT